MAEIELPFAVQEGNSSSPQNSAETLINMWAEIEDSGRKKIIRRQRPGLSEAAEYGVGNNGAYKGWGAIERYGDYYWIMHGGVLFWFNAATFEWGEYGGFDDLTGHQIATNVNGRGAFIFSDNADVLFAYEGYGVVIPFSDWRAAGPGLSGGYVCGPGVAVETPDGVLIGTMAFLGGRGVISVPGSNSFYWTDINDFTTIDGLSFASAESFPDAIQRVFVLNNELILWGTYSTEFWVPTSNADAPFTPITNATMNRGIAGPYALAADDNTVHWLADDGAVYRLEGYRPARISTHAIERVIASVPEANRAGCEGLVYTFEGHKFVTFNLGSVTIQYNVATTLWNLAKSGDDLAWQVQGSSTRASEFVLTYKNVSGFGPALCRIDGRANTDQGASIIRKMISAPADANGKRISIPEFFLDVEVGRMAEGTEPEIMLRVALDGETFGNERKRSLGTTGDYKRKVKWRNLGQGVRPALEVSISDDVNLKVVNAVANAKVGNF